ncbi:MAG: hypothetical protein JJLCMIEE_03262 [Acidimicrobiales bacterium]|nr:MAG: hypothetical protein EDR02_00120 [Actinomycetota bacterium]MBV6510142.1 hypothetical protein [Acidimicrobiales bacterium]RIK03802.1 MAG: hypothetical protein DCC48_15445 [Acidobacteriota bacterium]
MAGDPLIWLATSEGLVVVDLAGETVEQHFEARPVTSVDARAGTTVAAVEGGGVQRRSPGGDAWQSLGLETSRIWVVALAADGTAYAGLEPAALWRLGSGPAAEIDLSKVPNHDFWHSPWGPADLNSVVVDGSRLVTGIEVGGVAVSTDGGDSWDSRNEGLYEDVHHVVTDGERFYATTGMGFHRSIDEGCTWVWENDGVDRGYTQGLALCGDRLVMSSASGPPPLWEPDGPDAAIFVADAATRPARWEIACEGFGGNIERQALQASGAVVVAGTTAGELIVSTDGADSFTVVREGLPPITSVALSPA